MKYTYLASDELEIRAGSILIGYVLRMTDGRYVALRANLSTVGQFDRQHDATTALMLAGSPF